ncbi:MAG: hypothetical protein LBN33_05595 [Desulfovibrio sp.]|nr:hypothetical protein [Desulfovibrio sp.]
MTEEEIDLLKRYTPFGGSVLEFGSGGSSSYFFEAGVKRLVSVESDKAWLGALAQTPIINFFYKKNRWLPIHANIGPTREFGLPRSSIPRLSWLQYHQGCWSLMPDMNFDLILIDGRFRVACLCQSLLRCANNNAVFIMHDFWPRQDYHCVLKLCSVIDQGGSSVVLKKKKRMNWRLLVNLLQAYQFSLD